MKSLVAMISMGLVIGALAIGFFLIRPVWQDLQDARQELSRLQRIYDREKKLNDNALRVLQDYQKISQDSKDKLNALIPQTFRSAQFIASIEDIAKRNSLILSAASIKPSEGQNDSAKVQSIAFTMNLSGRYASMKAFLNALEKSQTLIDVTILKFDVSDVDSFPFSLSGRLYVQSLPAK